MRLPILAAALAVVGPAAAQDKDDLARQARQILTVNCYRCHGQNGSAEGGFGKALDFASHLGGKVVPGDPDKSRLFKRAGKNKDMPPEEEKQRPTDAEIAVLEKWIQAGAPAPPADAEPARSFVGLADELTAMRDHLRKVDRADRPYVRFFTLRHLHNLPGDRVKGSDLRVVRAALSKVVNSLSRRKDIVVPKACDPAGTVLAVNLKDLDWDRPGPWEAVLRAYPYLLLHDKAPDQAETRDLAAEVYELAGTTGPAVRADWFVATAARPPLYHTLLDLPTSAGRLERDLGVDVAANIRTGAKARRAGFNASGVSGHNRLVERHPSRDGAYWKSYDFTSSAGRGNLFVYPLGPAFPDHPYPRNVFRHDGGEVIFSLPNGLQGYFLVDGKDDRIDEGPIAVVSDGKKTSGTPAIVNGLSCMACHAHGTIPFADQVRDGHILGGAARDFVKRLYPEAAEMDELVAKDRRRFLAALEEAVGPFLKVGADKGRPIEDFPEPVSAIARWYLGQELGPEEAAREVGLSDVKTFLRAVENNARLQELGLFPLRRGNAIKREVWESRAEGFSPFQVAARELRLGVPILNP
jgi:mono/diheme cytochrome c family protein